LFADADEQLFSSILANNEHMLHNYMPERATPSYHHHYRESIAKNSSPKLAHAMTEKLKM